METLGKARAWTGGARSFDVICAGEALWQTDRRDARPSGGGSLALVPGGGAANAALALAAQGLAVGLATVVTDDAPGRALIARIAAHRVDVGGVELARRGSGIVLVESGAAQLVVSTREEEHPIAVPERWSSQVLLLSGVSPAVAHTAALCKAARAARRAGTIVVVDVNARWHHWGGREPRILRMLLREADVVWCSAEDLWGLHLDVDAVKGALRASAVLVVSDGAGTVSATGPFGEIARTSPRAPSDLLPHAEGAAFTAAICAELARSGLPGDGRIELWSRALDRGRAAALRGART